MASLINYRAFGFPIVEQSSLRGRRTKIFAAGLGIGPRIPAPKAGVLPIAPPRNFLKSYILNPKSYFKFSMIATSSGTIANGLYRISV